jgi:hypothetical protein
MVFCQGGDRDWAVDDFPLLAKEPVKVKVTCQCLSFLEEPRLLIEKHVTVRFVR